MRNYSQLRAFFKDATAKTNARMLRASVPAEDPEQLLLEMYGPIGASYFDDNGTTAQDVADALKGPQSSVTVRLNSPGGSAFEGIAIYNLLKSSGKKVRVVVDGVAASAASVIAMAGDEIEMGVGTLLMIHPPQILAFGPADEMRSAAAFLDKLSAGAAEIYAARSGQSPEKVAELMNDETWMTPDDAIALGFATKKSDEPGDAETTAQAFNLSAVYSKVPETLKAAPAPQAQAVPELPKGTPRADVERRALELL